MSEYNSAQLYKRLLTYAFRYRWFVAISLSGFILFSAMESAMAQMMEYFISGLEKRDSQYIYLVPIAVVVLRILHGIGGYLGNFFISRVGVNVVADLRKELFAKLVYLPTTYYDQHNSGELVSLLVYNITQVTGSVTNAVKIALRDGLTVIALLSLMIYHNWQLTLCFLVTVVVIYGCSGRWCGLGKSGCMNSWDHCAHRDAGHGARGRIVGGPRSLPRRLCTRGGPRRTGAWRPATGFPTRSR